MGISPPPGTPPTALLGYGSIISPVICHGSPRRVTSQSFPRATPPIARGHRLVYCGLQAHHLAMTGKYLLKDYSIFKVPREYPLTMYKVKFLYKWTPCGEKFQKKSFSSNKFRSFSSADCKLLAMFEWLVPFIFAISRRERLR